MEQEKEENKRGSCGGIVMLDEMVLNKKYKKECTPEDIAKIKELIRNPKLLEDLKPRDFYDFGYIFKSSNKEKKLFVKKPLDIYCYPPKRTIVRESKNIGESCYYTKECKDGQCFGSYKKYVSGTCKKPVAPPTKGKLPEGSKCSKDNDCEIPLKCKGRIPFIKKGQCAKEVIKPVEPVKKSEEKSPIKKVRYPVERNNRHTERRHNRTKRSSNY